MILLILTALTTIAFLLAVFAPDTDAGCWVRAHLVDRPARVLGDPMKTTVGIIGLLFVVGLALAAPEVALVMGMADMSLVFDLVALTVVLGAMNGMKASARRLAQAARRLAVQPARLLGRARAPRAVRRPRRARPAKPSDDGAAGVGWSWAFA